MQAGQFVDTYQNDCYFKLLKVYEVTTSYFLITISCGFVSVNRTVTMSQGIGISPGYYECGPHGYFHCKIEEK